MNAAAPSLVDAATVRAFIVQMHERAAKALEGEDNPGWLQLVFIDPRTGRTSQWRFAIGDVENMVAAAVDMAGKGFNVYIEGRTVVPNAPRRGEAKHTRFVFAFVVDSDADKDGKSVRLEDLPIPPSMIVESSPGNSHFWFFLDKAIPVQEGQPIGQAIKAKIGGDHDTGTITQPFRVAGTPNYPSAKKQKRERKTVEKTLIVKGDGPSYSVEALKAAFPFVESKKKSNGEKASKPKNDKTGIIDPEAEAIAAEPASLLDDRSTRFYAAVATAFRAGMGRDDLEAMFLRHPNGCAQKYLEGRDRLRDELERSWEKIEAEEAEKAEKAKAEGDAESPEGENESVAPTYPAGAEIRLGDARELLAKELSGFAEKAQAHTIINAEHEARYAEIKKSGDAEQIAQHKRTKPVPPVLALKMTTGVGKTEEAARLIASARKTLPIDSPLVKEPLLFLVPTHKLGGEIAEKFAAYGLKGEVWRGREAINPDADFKADFDAGSDALKDGATMCQDLEAVRSAYSLGLSAQTSVCEGKDPEGRKVKCPFFQSCAYQAQKEKKPDVWIASHEMPYYNSILSTACAVVIDETFYEAGLAPLSRGVTFDEIEARLPNDFLMQIILKPAREKLSRALRAQSDALAARLDNESESGGIGVHRRFLADAGLTTAEAVSAREQEKRLRDADPPIWPGMAREERRKATAAAAAKGSGRYSRELIRVWDEVEHLLACDDESAVSGRMFIDKSRGERGITHALRTRGLKSVCKNMGDKPTFIMDATLPGLAILEKFYSQIEIVADVEVAMFHVSVRQVSDAPTAKTKLVGKAPKSDSEASEASEVTRNLRNVYYYILKRWAEFRRQKTLVVCQKEVERHLCELGLPDGVHVEHFGNITGVDRYGDVRLLLVIGRTLPGPKELESDAGALSGFAPIPASKNPKSGGTWYDRVTHGIRVRARVLANPSESESAFVGVPTRGDRHPDPLVEELRHHICEGGLIQALGRGRGVNRTAADPLQVDLLTNVCLPLTIDEVVSWETVKVGAEAVMLAAGVWLDSPSDMAKVWPHVWPTEEAAHGWRKRFTAGQSPIEIGIYRDLTACGRYQLPGPRQKWRTFRFDPSAVPDPKAWLEERLGPFAGFEVEGEGESKAETAAIVRTPRGFVLRECELLEVTVVRPHALRLLPLYECPHRDYTNGNTCRGTVLTAEMFALLGVTDATKGRALARSLRPAPK